MKLTGRDAAQFLLKPDRRFAAVLLHGADAMRVALKRQTVVAALLGSGEDAQMQLTRLEAAELRKDPARLFDAVKSSGFFDAGGEVVLVEGAGDGLVSVFEPVLSEWAEGDSAVVVTAGLLPARSKLRKLFEGAANAASIGIYDNPPGRDEIEAILNKAGLGDSGAEVMRDLIALATVLDPGDFAQTVEKIAVYKHGDAAPLTSEEIALCAPITNEAAIDDAIRAVAEGQSGEVVPQLRRLEGQGVGPTTLCIAATRHFRQIHAVAASGKGIDAALSSMRPPVFGPRRDQLARQVRRWGAAEAEKALRLLTDTDLALRSSGNAPQAALVERAFIRLAMMVR